MAMLAEQYRYVIGGDPDRDTIDLAVLDTATGGVQAHLVDAADGAGYARMLAWADEHAPRERVWALEGTGSFAAGFAQTLAEAGEAVVEVGAVKRARGAKNDRLDAVRAARTALAREFQTLPRARGLREALRMVLATRAAVLVSRTKAINELKSLIIVAPEHLRAQLRGLSLTRQLSRIEALQTPAAAEVEHRGWHRWSPSTRPAPRSWPNPESARSSQRRCWCPGRTAGESVAKLPSPRWQERLRWKPAAANASDIGSTAAATATSIGLCTPSRSHASAATPRPALTMPPRPPAAKPTGKSVDRSSGPWPDASTDACKQRPGLQPNDPPPLDKHRSVQRPAAPVLPQEHRSVSAQRRGS
jgi:hypothetical protein